VLRAAGVEPVVVVSGVDEDAVVAGLAGPTPDETVAALAAAKAEAVAATITGDHEDTVVIGCDSMLRIGADLVGKPGTVDRARQRWLAMAGGSGHLLTGHAVLRMANGEITARAAGVRGTEVRFGTPTERELEAYLATGEPLAVAGAFTLDGVGGWFVEGVDGDPSSVIGISLPLTRQLLAEVGIGVADLLVRAG
jgi:septum formation protein